MKVDLEKETHCGYYHDKDGICCNDSCRESGVTECRDEWESCPVCEGKGYLPKKAFEKLDL